MGEYTLTHLLGTHETHDVYVAEQGHVGRSVVMQVLSPQASPTQLQEFILSARVRVATKLPQVVSVLESQEVQGQWFIIQELPPGTPLSEGIANGAKISVAQGCDCILKASQLYQLCAKQNIATDAFTPDMIFLSADGKQFSFITPVKAGAAQPETRGAQMQALAQILTPLLPENMPGSRRLATLCYWLHEGFDEQVLEWDAIDSTAHLIQNQLSLYTEEEAEGAQFSREAMDRQTLKRRKQRWLRWTGIAALLLLMLVLSSWLTSMLLENAGRSHARYISCEEAGKNYFAMERAVSVSEYAQFLEAFQSMTPAEQALLQAGIPESARQHTPGNWKAQVSTAAQKSTPFPVTQVSYWSAVCYARWCEAELPSATLLTSIMKAQPCKKSLEEWARPITPQSPLLQPFYCSVNRNAQVLEINKPDERQAKRSFRLIYNTLPTL